MTNLRLRRMLLAASALAVVAILASGCSAIQNLSGHLAGLTTTPRVGDCWTTSFSDAQASETWQGTQAIPCNTAHESYTYAVTKLATTFTYSSWLTSDGKIRTDVDKAALDACTAETSKILPGYSSTEALLYPTYYLPSTSLWSAGARWVRCDITLITVGSTIAKPALADLPSFATLRTTLKSDPTKYGLCEDDPANNGPDGSETTYADCTGAADYTLLGELTMAGGNGAAYPGLAALTKLGAIQCATLHAPAGHDIISEPPFKLDWTKYDDRILDCWVNNN